MKIGMRLVVVISIINIISISLLAGLTIVESRQEIVRLTDDQARVIAKQSSEHIDKRLSEYIDAVRSLAQIMEGYKRIPAEERRDRFNFLLSQIAGSNTGVSAWTYWGPNLLDGLDEQYVNTLGTNGNGRYSIIWYNVPEGFAAESLLRESWQEALQMKIDVGRIFEPFIYETTGVTYLSTSISVPIKDNGTPVGYVGFGFELSAIQAIVNEIKPFGNGHALLFSSGGFIVGHSDPGRLGKDMRESEQDTFGPYLETMVGAVTTGTAAAVSYRPAGSDSVMQYYAVPFTISFFPQTWTLVVGVPRDTIMAPVYRMIRICIIIGILTIILMSAGVILTARSISNPLAHTMAVLKDIAEGDLTKEITIHSRDELGDLAHYLNFTVDSIKRLVLSIRKEADVLSQTGVDLAANVAETAAAINEITASIQNIAAQSGKQEVSVKNTEQTMGEVVKNTKMLNIQIQKQTDRISQSSWAVEEMLKNIQNVTQTLMGNEKNITGLAEVSEVGKSGLMEVSSDIHEIAKESEGLLEINAVMQNIASQTNLLSMNAAIEAAHAGAAGKGFAVVADEIRKLAESSANQSKTIGGMLKKIKGSIDKITKSTEGALLKFEAINEGVRMVTMQETNVRSAMEEQDAGSKSILDVIVTLKAVTREVITNAQATAGKSREVLNESRALGEITEEITGGMREIAVGAEQINQAVNCVNDISIENERQIKALMGEVSRFKVE
ncbi:MAG: methyl-accepting chemotaxis protein [Treponema sp.]|jgi:methyl-accepting chemotaxis protein|nr:methyl-accepting chemotaxis protein [Treponema sp.]